MAHLDYLVIGHVTLDLTPTGATTGGTVTYAARAAQALGATTAALTSFGPDFAAVEHLPGIIVQAVPSATTTTFTNSYTPAGRQQLIHSRAQPLTLASLPAAWRNPGVVHLGPVADEVDPAFAGGFGDSVIGVTPQGWLRRWDEKGRVFAREWALAAQLLPQADVVILSLEDLPDPAMLAQFRQWSRLLILTREAAGCTVFHQGGATEVPGLAVNAVESTGAGDIFAAAFCIFWQAQPGDPIPAAAFANQVAGLSVTAATPAAKFAKIRQYIAAKRPRSLNL